MPGDAMANPNLSTPHLVPQEAPQCGKSRARVVPPAPRVAPGTVRPLRVVPASLFHGTTIPCAIEILRDDSLLEGAYWGKKNEPHGPRFTLRPEVAQSFSTYPYAATNIPGGVVLEFDGPELARRHALVGYFDTTYDGHPMSEEFEVAALTEGVEGLSGLLKAVHVEPFPEAEIQDLAAFVAETWETSPEAFLEAYRGFLAHPAVVLGMRFAAGA